MKEIEKVFLKEIQEKKNHAYNNRSRTGGGGGSSSRKGVRTAYDYMSSKEKKKLNSEIEVFNMYETIIPLKEFELKDEETQKKLLTRWREIYPNAKIIKEMGFRGLGLFLLRAYKKIGHTQKRKLQAERSKQTKAKSVRSYYSSSNSTRGADASRQSGRKLAASESAYFSKRISYTIYRNLYSGAT